MPSSTTFSLRLPNELLDLLDARVEKMGASRNAVVVDLLDRSLRVPAPTQPLTAGDADSKLDPYPSLPTEPGARRAAVDARNAAFQKIGIAAPASGTFGSPKKSAA